MAHPIRTLVQDFGWIHLSLGRRLVDVWERQADRDRRQRSAGAGGAAGSAGAARPR